MADKQSRGNRARCRRCNRTIRVPAGWSVGAATRRHYWAKHRAVMLRSKGVR